MNGRDLSAWLAYQEALHPDEIELGLERCGSVLERLGLRWRMPVITVAGTNGKGSTAALIADAAIGSGYRAALYTSPHLVRYQERLTIAGAEVEDDAWCSAFERVEQARAGTPLTYFEFGTLAALVLIADSDPQLAVLEVGLGGRLDAVNAVDPDVAVITSVDLDHQSWLGEDRASIGREKAGIARRDRPLICVDPDPPPTVAEVASETGARELTLGAHLGLELGEDRMVFELPEGQVARFRRPAGLGVAQARNALAAYAALSVLAPGLQIDPAAFQRALDRRPPGRAQAITVRGCRVILDVAHNPAAARALSEVLPSTAGPTVAVVGMLDDKNVAGLVAALEAEVSSWVPVGLSVPRGRSARAMVEALTAAGVRVEPSRPDPVAGLEAALGLCGPHGQVLVVGSFHTVGAIMASALYSRPELTGGRGPQDG